MLSFSDSRIIGQGLSIGYSAKCRMDKLSDYSKIIEGILQNHVELCNRRPNPEVENFLVVDREKGHYIWMNLGWRGSKRITAMTVYVRLQQGKFWIEEDWTEEGIATELLQAGVPKENIVLAFQKPEMRQYTEFAIA